MERRRLTLTEKLAIMTRQARCPVCGEKLGRLEDCEFDHEIALARGGEDSLTNLRAIHAVPCHLTKTSGTKATTRGSDIHEIAKERRVKADQDDFRRRLLAKSGQAEPTDDTAPARRKGKWPKRSFRS